MHPAFSVRALTCCRGLTSTPVTFMSCSPGLPPAATACAMPSAVGCGAPGTSGICTPSSCSRLSPTTAAWALSSHACHPGVPGWTRQPWAKKAVYSFSRRALDPVGTSLPAELAPAEAGPAAATWSMCMGVRAAPSAAPSAVGGTTAAQMPASADAPASAAAPAVGGLSRLLDPDAPSFGRLFARFGSSFFLSSFFPLGSLSCRPRFKRARVFKVLHGLVACGCCGWVR